MRKKGGEGEGREVSTRSSSCLRCSCSSGPLTFHAAAVLARAFFSLDLSHTHRDTHRDRYETVPQRKSKPVRLSLSLSHSLCAVENRYLFARRNAALSFCPMPQAGRGARGRDGGRRCVTMTLRFASHLKTDSLVFSCSALPFPLLTPCPPLILSHDFVSVACLFAILSALGCLNLLLEPLHLMLLFFLLFYFFFLLVIYATCCSNS